jgi:hypothetical protein
MIENKNVFDFELSAEGYKCHSDIGHQKRSLFQYRDPEMVEMADQSQTFRIK